MSLWEMSFSGAVMIVVITLVRALLVNRLPKTTFLALWAVALARLLIPYSLPSALSVYSLFQESAPAAVTARKLPALPTVVYHSPAPVVEATAPTPAAPGWSVDIWTAVWWVGMLACGLFFAVSYFRCRREFQRSLPVDHAAAQDWLEAHSLRRKIAIRCSDRVSTPLTYGVLRPVILLPKTADWEDMNSLKYALEHEYVHICRFDALWKLALTVALCVHWFDPLVWVMYALANRDMELACDEAVVRRFGMPTRAAYALTLIRMEATRSGLAPLCNSFGKNAIEERIVAIMKIKKTSLAALIVAGTLVVGVTVAFATSEKPDAQPPAGSEQDNPAKPTTDVQDAAGKTDSIIDTAPEEGTNASTSFAAATTYAIDAIPGDWTWPLDGDYSVTYDGNSAISRVDPLTGARYVHPGVDIAAPEGTPVKAAADGTVSRTGLDAKKGNFVELSHTDGGSSLYNHLQSVSVAQGDQVAQGDVIGTVGNTGMSTGPHLHFEMNTGDAAAVNR